VHVACEAHSFNVELPHAFTPELTVVRARRLYILSIVVSPVAPLAPMAPDALASASDNACTVCDGVADAGTYTCIIHMYIECVHHSHSPICPTARIR
jgi:hypothetical protein